MLHRSRFQVLTLTSRWRFFLCAILFVALQHATFAAWVAFNDHAGTNTTHINATRWNVFGTANGAPGSSGPLKNIQTGANLPVTLTLLNSGASGAGTQASPYPGTPAYSVFNGFVDFRGTPSPSVELDGADVVTYTFSGLDPSKRYNFVGTSVRGDATYVNRWTLVQIQAASFIAAHTVNVLTSNQVPTLLPTQCAINTGVNHTSNTGDYAGWDQIQPNANGTIVITCQHYRGTVPGGASDGPRGYGITGIRLEELPSGPTPLSILAQPASVTTVENQSTNLTVVVSGSDPRYQWFSSNSPILNATNATLSFSNIARADAGAYFVIVTNSVSSITSSVATVTVNRAPPPTYILIGLTNQVWRYDDTDPTGGPPLISGLSWKQPDYNDTAWPSGRGILAFEDNAAITPRTNTVLRLFNANDTRIITYYFRTHFTLTNKPETVSLVLSNLIDDGAVAYLNGTEVWRFNLPGGTISSSTLASSASTENVFFTTNVPSALLKQGDNVLAFEVHQNSATSADIVFGTVGIVAPLPPGPLTITAAPHDVTVPEGAPFELKVGVTGVLADYQWFKDGVAIPGANNSTYAVPAAARSHAGVYLVTITNSDFSVMTEPVQVFVDTNAGAPVLLEASGESSWIRTMLTFDRLLLASTATNIGNYEITNTFGETLPITAITLTNGTNVILHTPVRRADANYIVVVNNVAGLAATQPWIVPNSSLPVRTRVLLVGPQDPWQFYDPYPPFENPDPGVSWNQLDYDASEWGIGDGAFHWGNSVVSVPVNTTLSASAALVSYFRLPFESSFSPAGMRLEMRPLVNDGAAFYLNGQEFFRTNLPNGAISFDTPATATGAVVLAGTPVVIEPNTFVDGLNLFSVELHQSSSNNEKAFALEMFASVQSLVTGPVVITGGPRDTTVFEGAPVRFSADVAGAAWFQWQMDGTNLPGATNATLVFPNASPSLDGRVFRLLAGNSQNSVWSTNATLRVPFDLEAPRLLSALSVNASMNQIVLAFSRALSPESAVNISNYVVTNASGAALAVTNATLLNGTNVVLSLNQALVGNYIVALDPLRDTTTVGNFTASGTHATVGASCNIPLDSAWKYLLINTNPAVQAAFAGVSYDDSAWSGPSNALLYVEDATLPGPKNTLLSLTDSVTGDRYNTYYFRQAFWSPVGASNITLRIRHVIDDGLVLHLNGADIHRFNMPGGVITASTQSAGNIGDAVLLGPFDVTNCTIVAGTNILAAEVHQNGAAGSDVVFGAEITGAIPSVAVNPFTTSSLKIFRWGNEAVTTWGPPGVLESAPSVSGPWQPVSVAKPFFIQTNGAATFFRLRQ